MVLDFLSAEQIQACQQLYDTLHRTELSGFYSTTYSHDLNYRKAVHDGINAIVRSSIEQYFQDSRIIYSSFIIKQPVEKSELVMHQDMSLVDERSFNAINFWSPLVDTTPENGALHLIPGSHQFFPGVLRASSIPHRWDGIGQYAMRFLEPVYVRAGQAVVFDPSLLHYSPDNRSGQVRVVINNFVVPAGAPLTIAYRNIDEPTDTGTRLDLYEQPDSYLLENHFFYDDMLKRPKTGKLIASEPFEDLQITEAEFHELWLNSPAHRKHIPAEILAPHQPLPTTGQPSGFIQRLRNALGW